MQAESGTAIAPWGSSSPWYRLKFTGSCVIIASRLRSSEVTVSSAVTLFSRSPKSTRATLDGAASVLARGTGETPVPLLKEGDAVCPASFAELSFPH